MTYFGYTWFSRLDNMYLILEGSCRKQRTHQAPLAATIVEEKIVERMCGVVCFMQVTGLRRGALTSVHVVFFIFTCVLHRDDVPMYRRSFSWRENQQISDVAGFRQRLSQMGYVIDTFSCHTYIPVGETRGSRSLLLCTESNTKWNPLGEQ